MDSKANGQMAQDVYVPRETWEFDPAAMDDAGIESLKNPYVKGWKDGFGWGVFCTCLLAVLGSLLVLTIGV